MEKFFPFRSVSGDRKYSAEDWASYFALFLSDGVCYSGADKLKVVAAEGMKVRVGKGAGFIAGRMYMLETDKTITLDTADGALNRIDRIVLRCDYTSRKITAEVVKGSYSEKPTAPALNRNSDIYELALADIYVAAGVISITQSNITDQRLNTDLCGIVTGLIDQADTEEIFNQFTAYLEEFKQESQVEFDEQKAAWEKEFDTWFNEIQAALEGNVAAELAARIVALEEDLAEVDGSESLTTSILEKALEVGNGIYSYRLAGSLYKGNDLPSSAYYAFGTASIHKQNESNIIVILWGINAANSKNIAINYYDKDKGWGEWDTYATTANLANYFKKTGGDVNGNVTAYASDATARYFMVQNSKRRAAFQAMADGYLTLYDNTNGKHIILSSPDGNTNTFNGAATENIPRNGYKPTSYYGASEAEINSVVNGFHDNATDGEYYTKVLACGAWHSKLGGGSRTVMGQRVSAQYGWQISVCYSEGASFTIMYRARNNGVWTEWDRPAYITELANYLPLSGGDITTDVTIGKKDISPYLRLEGIGAVSVRLPSGTYGGWDRGFKIVAEDGTDLGGFGIYGGGQKVTYYYMGGEYYNPILSVNPSERKAYINGATVHHDGNSAKVAIQEATPNDTTGNVLHVW